MEHSFPSWQSAILCDNYPAVWIVFTAESKCDFDAGQFQIFGMKSKWARLESPQTLLVNDVHSVLIQNSYMYGTYLYDGDIYLTDRISEGLDSWTKWTANLMHQLRVMNIVISVMNCTCTGKSFHWYCNPNLSTCHNRYCKCCYQTGAVGWSSNFVVYKRYTLRSYQDFWFIDKSIIIKLLRSFERNICVQVNV